MEPEVVTALVANLEGMGWFTDDMYTTWHHPCGECYTYSVTVTSGDETKTIGAVDGGTDAPAKYWLATSRISAILPESDGRSVMRSMVRGMVGLGALALCAVLAGCDYIVIPEQQSTAPPAQAEGVWTAVATASRRHRMACTWTWRIRNDTGDWSAMEIAEGGSVSLVDASGSSLAMWHGRGRDRWNEPPARVHHARLHRRDEDGSPDRAAPRRVRRGGSSRRLEAQDPVLVHHRRVQLLPA